MAPRAAKPVTPKKAGSKKPVTKKVSTTKPTAGRSLRPPAYRSFRLSKRLQSDSPALPSVWQLLKKSVVTLRENWRLFGGIWLIYGLLSLVILGTGQVLDISAIQAELDPVTGWSSLGQSLNIFQYLLTSDTTGGSEAGGIYQLSLLILVSLAVIWALRHVVAGQAATVRQSFYQGMYPLVPFVLVALVIVLQLLPMLLGLYLYQLVVNGGLAVTAAEQLVWGGLALTLSVLSLYMITSSLFAMYVVTLPDMTPLAALRSARQLVAHRRLTVLRKVVALPIAMVLVMALVVVPLIIIAAWLAEVIFFGLALAALPAAHVYMYTLYRELL